MKKSLILFTIACVAFSAPVFSEGTPVESTEEVAMSSCSKQDGPPEEKKCTEKSEKSGARCRSSACKKRGAAKRVVMADE